MNPKCVLRLWCSYYTNCIGCFNFILGLIGLWYLTEKLIIPAGREHAAFCVYQLTIIASMLNLLITPFNAEIIAHEKMGVFCLLDFT